MRIKSVLQPNAYAFELDSESHYEKRGNAPLNAYLLTYETYGDGLTQHSGSWCAQYNQFTDAALSLARAILEDPTNPEFRKLTNCIERYTDADLRWALSVKFVDGKEQFYSLATRKVTRADKRNDRRYERVQTFHDGTARSAFHILCQSHWDWFDRMILCDRLREVEFQVAQCTTDWETLFQPTKDLTGDWSQALAAFRSAITAVQHLDWAQRTAGACEHNSTVKPIIEQPVEAVA